MVIRMMMPTMTMTKTVMQRLTTMRQWCIDVDVVVDDDDEYDDDNNKDNNEDNNAMMRSDHDS